MQDAFKHWWELFLFSETAPLSRAAAVHAQRINVSLKCDSGLDSRKVKIVVIGRLRVRSEEIFLEGREVLGQEHGKVWSLEPSFLVFILALSVWGREMCMFLFSLECCFASELLCCCSITSNNHQGVNGDGRGFLGSLLVSVGGSVPLSTCWGDESGARKQLLRPNPNTGGTRRCGLRVLEVSFLQMCPLSYSIGLPVL